MEKSVEPMQTEAPVFTEADKEDLIQKILSMTDEEIVLTTSYWSLCQKQKNAGRTDDQVTPFAEFLAEYKRTANHLN